MIGEIAICFNQSKMSSSPRAFDEAELERCYDAKVARFYDDIYHGEIRFLEPCNYVVFRNYYCKGNEAKFIKEEQEIQAREKYKREEFKRCYDQANKRADGKLADFAAFSSKWKGGELDFIDQENKVQDELKAKEFKRCYDQANIASGMTLVDFEEFCRNWDGNEQKFIDQENARQKKKLYDEFERCYHLINERRNGNLYHLSRVRQAWKGREQKFIDEENEYQEKIREEEKAEKEATKKRKRTTIKK